VPKKRSLLTACRGKRKTRAETYSLVAGEGEGIRNYFSKKEEKGGNLTKWTVEAGERSTGQNRQCWRNLETHGKNDT